MSSEYKKRIGALLCLYVNLVQLLEIVTKTKKFTFPVFYTYENIGFVLGNRGHRGNIHQIGPGQVSGE